jgi:hypothetical protein
MHSSGIDCVSLGATSLAIRLVTDSLSVGRIGARPDVLAAPPPCLRGRARRTTASNAAAGGGRAGRCSSVFDPASQLVARKLRHAEQVELFPSSFRVAHGCS